MTQRGRRGFRTYTKAQNQNAERGSDSRRQYFRPPWVTETRFIPTSCWARAVAPLGWGIVS
eukprot:6297023-Alexandrium_andersonii.AAC.1